MSKSANNLPVINVGTALREQLDAEVAWLKANRNPGTTLSSLVRDILVEAMQRRAAERSREGDAPRAAPQPIRPTGTG